MYGYPEDGAHTYAIYTNLVPIDRDSGSMSGDQDGGSTA